MDGRARFAIGGFLAGAASIAVVSAVALSNTTALADTPGTAVGLSPVRLSAASATPAAAASSGPLLVATPDSTTQTVPAPQAALVAPSTAATKVATSAPEAVQDLLVADAQRSGSWDAARHWAQSHGWSQEHIDHLVSALAAKLAKAHTDSADSSAFKKSAHAGISSGSKAHLPSGSKRDRSHVPPDGD